MREAFEAWMSDDGQFPKAIERDCNGNYLLATAANGWRVWQAAHRHACPCRSAAPSDAAICQWAERNDIRRDIGELRTMVGDARTLGGTA